jgi:hypothetical protein
MQSESTIKEKGGDGSKQDDPWASYIDLASPICP